MTDTDNSAIAELQRRFETLHGKLDIHLALQKAIFERLAPAQRFTEIVPQQNSMAIPKGQRGVIRSIHNPSAQALTVTLYNGQNQNGTPIFSAQLAAGEYRLTYSAFNDGVITAGVTGGAVLSGDYDA